MEYDMIWYAAERGGKTLIAIPTIGVGSGKVKQVKQIQAPVPVITWLHSFTHSLTQSVSQFGFGFGFGFQASSWLSHGSIQAFPIWACNPPVAVAEIQKYCKKNKGSKIYIEINAEAKKVSRPYRLPRPIVFCGSSIIMTVMQPDGCRLPLPPPLWPEPRNRPTTFCLICICRGSRIASFWFSLQLYAGL